MIFCIYYKYKSIYIEEADYSLTAIINIIQISTILAYSAKKKNTNITAACSVINPLINSDSASAKSKGARFVSAIDPIKKLLNRQMVIN